MLGPRFGRFSPSGTVNEIPGHSLTMTTLGAMILFTGFLAFNSGSQTQLSDERDLRPVTKAAVNTVISVA